jgi:hypothetical protein
LALLFNFALEYATISNGGLELNGIRQLQINTGPVTIQNKNKNATTRNTEVQLNDCF